MKERGFIKISAKMRPGRADHSKRYGSGKIDVQGEQQKGRERKKKRGDGGRKLME